MLWFIRLTFKNGTDLNGCLGDNENSARLAWDQIKEAKMCGHPVTFTETTMARELLVDGRDILTAAFWGEQK